MKRLLDYDADTGIQTWHDYDHHTKETVIAEVQDVAPVLEANKAARNQGNGGAKGLNEVAQRGIKNNWWHAASVPNSVILKWKKELGVDIYNKDHLPAVKKLLNDRDWAYLRTGTGRV